LTSTAKCAPDKCHPKSISIFRKRRGRTENCAGFVTCKLKRLRGNRPQKHHKKARVTSKCRLRLAGELGGWIRTRCAPGKEATTCKFHNMVADVMANQSGTAEKKHSFDLRGDFGAHRLLLPTFAKGSMLATCVCKVGGIQSLVSTGVQHLEPRPRTTTHGCGPTTIPFGLISRYSSNRL